MGQPRSKRFTIVKLAEIVGFSARWLYAARHAGLGQLADGTVLKRISVSEFNEWYQRNQDFRVRTVCRWAASSRKPKHPVSPGC